MTGTPYNSGTIGSPGPVGPSSYNAGTVGSPGPAGPSPYNSGTIGPGGPVGPSPYNTPGTVGSSGPAGPDPYNSGTIGSSGPAGPNPYNQGTIGSSGPAGSDPYNQGTIGSTGPAGPNPYHQGRIGGSGPAGSDPYHYGSNIGSTAPAGSDPYHYGLIGNNAPAGVPAYNKGKVGSSKPVSKPSYNQGLIGTSDPAGIDAYHYTETFGDKGPVGKPAYNNGKIGDKNALSGNDYNRGLRGSPSIPNMGPPSALDPAGVVGPGSYSGAYHGDVVFYLQRAGEGGGGDADVGGFQLAEDETPGSVTDGGAVVGGDAYNDGSQSGWNQGAMGEAAPSTDYDMSGMFEPSKPAGKIPYEDEPPGSFTVAGSETTSLGEAIANAFPVLDSFEDREEFRTKASSEVFFNKALNKAFNPDSAEDILGSLERGSRAELALQLAKATGYVNNTEDFINGINSGRFGVVTQATRSSNALLGKNRGMTYRSMR